MENNLKNKDMPGRRFGKLTVISLDCENISKNRRWFCKCDCGTIKSIWGSPLRRGRIVSCGCSRSLDRNYPEPSPVKNARWICLGYGRFTLIDADQYEIVSKKKWTLSAAGYARTNGFVNGKKSANVYLHRFILGLKSGEIADHISGDKLDNRKSNLRTVTQSENIHNTHCKPRSSTGFRGVIKSRGKYTATITVCKKRIYMGEFLASHEAARAYDFASAFFYGKHCFLNFKD